jgi:hypothetical protein
VASHAELTRIKPQGSAYHRSGSLPLVIWPVGHCLGVVVGRSVFKTNGTTDNRTSTVETPLCLAVVIRFKDGIRLVGIWCSCGQTEWQYKVVM